MGGYSLIVMHGLLIAVASLFAAHEALGHGGSVAVARRLQGRLIRFSRVQLFVNLWTYSPPGSSAQGNLQGRILE